MTFHLQTLTSSTPAPPPPPGSSSSRSAQPRGERQHRVRPGGPQCLSQGGLPAGGHPADPLGRWLQLQRLAGPGLRG